MHHKLKAGILLNDWEVPAWILSLILELKKREYLEFSVVLLQQESFPGQHQYVDLSGTGWLYRWYHRMDEKLFLNGRNALERKNTRGLLVDVPVLNVPEKLQDQKQTIKWPELEEKALDVILDLRIKREEDPIGNFAKYGLWYLVHGSHDAIRSHIPGLWESIKKHSVTGTFLMMRHDEHFEEKILYKSWAMTHAVSPSRNRNNNYWKGISFIPRVLDILGKEGEESFIEYVEHQNQHHGMFNGKVYGPPGNMNAAYIGLRQIMNIGANAFQKLIYKKQWFLRYRFQPDIGTFLPNATNILPPRNVYWADPFVIMENDTYYVFIEEVPLKTDRGHISVMKIDKEGNWEEPVKILEKPYHLSYPFVFEWEEKYYMIPESGANASIQLYECTEFPYKWKHKMNLMQGIEAFDATLHYHNGLWWMFVSVREHKGASSSEELYLFFAEDFRTTNWEAHPQNPIVSDARNARPAGKLYTHNGKLYRPSQNCSGVYGFGFNINEVLTLNEYVYEERKVHQIEPEEHKGIYRTHTFNFEEGMVIVDGLRLMTRF